MANSIGSNLETQIILDASGVRTGAQRGVEAMQMFEAGAERLGDSLSDIGSRSSAMTQSLERAAGMMELMTAKMLAADRAGSGGVRAAMTDRISAWQQWIKEQAGFLAEQHAIVEQDRSREMAALRRDIEERLALQQRYRSQWAAEEAGFLARIHTEAERERSQEMAALRRDIEERLSLQQRYRAQWAAEQVAADQRDAQLAERAREEELAALREDIIARANAESAADRDRQMRAEQRARAAYRAEQRVRADAARFNEGAQPQNPLRTTTGNISNNFRGIARDAVLWERGRIAAQQAEQAVMRMRGHLNPMVAMETRLANEAREFREQLDLAVRAGIIQLAQADQLTQEFQQQSALLMQQARQQQQGFLGMRKFGFAAQQAGYAIEDAAAMYGTMGAAGAFRAASNNLTAMAAGLNPWIGVVASLGAAAAAIGLHLWESKKAAEEATKSEEKLLKTREDLLSVQERMIEHEQTLRDLRRASSGADVQSAIQAQLDAAIKADAAAREQVRRAPILAIEAQIEAIQAQMSALPGRQFGSGPAVDASGAASQRQRVELANQLVDLQEKRIKLYEEEGILLKKMDSDEQKFAERQRERELAFTRSLEVRNTKIAEAFAPEQRDTQIGLMQEMQKLEMERLTLANGRYKTEVDLINAMTQHGEILDKQVAVAERMAALRKEGLEAERASREMITGRFEAVNDELKFTNDQTRARKELNEQLQKSIDAGTITQQQAAAMRNEMERILQIEKQNRITEQRIEGLQQRESRLEELMSGRSREASVMAATFAGTDDAARIIEQERLRLRQQDDQRPVVDELRQIRRAINQQKAVLERNAQATPDPVAALF